jgi:hypothetical protein
VAKEGEAFCGECGASIGSEIPISSPTPPPSSEPSFGPGPSFTPIAGPNQKAQIAFWLGIVSVVLDVLSCRSPISFIGCIGPVVGIIAIVLGYLAKQEIETQGGTEGDRNKANQGMIVGIVGTVLPIVLFILTVVFLLGMSFLAEMGLISEF